MNTVLSLFRMVCVAAAGGLGLVLLLGDEPETTTGAFLLHFLFDKALAALLLVSAAAIADKKARGGLCRAIKGFFNN